ncbi:DUF1189 family protein [Candidatus Woesearchaeota archaeon]|nr:DUF1189 family protein [Candidatus Woesearchaeota archaeon]
MSKLAEFLKEAGGSLNPQRYKQFVNRGIRHSIRYFFAALLLSFVLMSLAGLPKMVTLPGYVQERFEVFTALSLGGNVTMKEPLRIPEEDPQFIIDTTGQTTELGRAKILVTKDVLSYKLEKPRSIRMETFSNFLQNKAFLSYVISAIVLLVLPGLLITMSIVFALKYFAFSTLAALVVFVLLDLTKFKMLYRDAFKIMIYAATPMMLLEVTLVPYVAGYLLPLGHMAGITFQLVPILLYLLFIVLGVLAVQWGRQPLSEGKLKTS